MTGAPMFHVADYVVFAVTILLSLGIGIYFAFAGRKQTSNAEFLIGDRSMKLVPVAISLLVSFLSTIGILGHPAEIFTYGTQFMMYIVAMVLGLTYGTFLFVPLYFPLKLTSVFEYHRMRFGVRYVEIAGVILGLISMILFNAILLYSPCMAFEAVSGVPAWASIIISGLTATIYTSLGGMKAVVWTDVFQSVIIFAGLIAIVVKGTIAAGGIREVWRINEEWNRISFFDFRIDPTIRLTFWNVCVLNSLLWMCMTGSQPSMQRFISLPTMRQAKMSTLLIIPGFVLSGLLTCVCGVTAFAYYAKKGCDPLHSGAIKSPNQIMPYFVMDVLNIPSLPGLFIASLFSASLSSVSSAYNAMAAITWQNLLQQRWGHLSNQAQANISKICTAGYGLLSILSAFVVMGAGGTLIQITYSVIGATGGPLIGTMLVGALFTKVEAKAVLISTVLSLAFCLWLSIGRAFSGIYDPPLPAPTNSCHVALPNTSHLLEANQSAADLTVTMAAGVLLLYNDTSSLNVSDATRQHAGMRYAFPERTGLQKFYSISYFWYPFFGMSIVIVLSVILTIIPVFRHTRPVPKKLVFPFLRGCIGVEEPSITEFKPADKLMTKPYLHTKDTIPNGDKAEDTLNDEYKPLFTGAHGDASPDHVPDSLTDMPDDVWIRRDDPRMVAYTQKYLEASPGYRKSNNMSTTQI